MNSGLTRLLASAAAVGLLLAPVACTKKKKKSDPSVATTSETGGNPTGALALSFAGSVGSTSSSSGSSLTSGEDSSITCQVEGLPETAQSATVDGTTGEFTYTAAQVQAFIGQVVSCSVTLSDGTVNYLPSFAVPEDAIVADVKATYDATTGAVSSEPEIETASGQILTASDTYAPLPAELMAFDPTGITGEYSRKNCETSDASAKKNIRKGDTSATGINASSCEGWEQQGLYVIGAKGVAGSAEPVVQDTPPTLAMWNRKADYDACYSSGSLNMSISDGTNSFSFGDGTGVTVSALYDKIVASGWAPQVAIDRANAANPAAAPADPESAQIRGVLEQHYTEPCSGFAADLAKDWAKLSASDVTKTGGRAVCGKALVYSSSPASQINEMLNQEVQSADGGGMVEECGQYVSSKSEKGKKKAVDRFVSMCKSFLAGEPGEHEQMQAKLELVDAFVRSIGELKWQTGDSRFDGLKRAMKGLDLDTPSGISLANLEALAREWMLVSWDWRARRVLEYAISSMSSAISGADQWLGINGMTGRAAIEAMLNDSNTRNNLDELVCSDQWQMPSLVQMVGESTTTALEAKLSAPSQSNNYQSTWNDQSLTESQKKTLLINFINAFLAKSIEHCERVRLTSQKTQINNYTSGGNNNWNPIENFPSMMLGHQLMEAKQRKVMEEIGSLLASGTYSQLLAKSQELSALRMGGEDWISREMQRYQEKGYDQAGMLYQLKQMLGSEAARSAFRYDNTYLAKMRTIKEASACLPDAKVSWQADIDANGAEVHNVAVYGPVKQIFKAGLALNGDTVRAVDTRLENGGSCYWGNVNGFTAIPTTAFQSAAGFTSPYMMAWFNGCGGGGSSSEDSTNGMFSVSILSPVVNQ